MASIVDSFSEALNDHFSCAKIIGYAIPVYFLAQLFVIGKTSQFQFWSIIIGVLFLGLLTQGINNVRRNKKEVLSINPAKIGLATLKALVVLVPQVIVFGAIGKYITKHITIPINLPHTQQIFNIVIWAVLFSIILTSYLSFAKYLKISQGYNIKVIYEYCIDVFVGFLFFIPQLCIANYILIWPVWYLFSVFNLTYEHWGFIAYCSAIFVLNISMIANYLAQIAFEQIKGNNEEYQDNIQISILDETTEKLNGR